MAGMMHKGMHRVQVSKGENTGMKKERSRWEIIHDILKAAQEEKYAKKTRIMQKAYLDWRNFQRYFDFLVDEGFLSNSPGGESYEPTERGRQLFDRLSEVRAILESKKF